MSTNDFSKMHEKKGRGGGTYAVRFEKGAGTIIAS